MRSAADPVIPPDVLRQLGQSSDLLGSWWLVGAIVILAAVLAAFAVRRRRRHRRTWPHWTGVGLTLLLALAQAANVVSGYMPNVHAARVTAAEWGIGRVTPLAHGTPVARAGQPAAGGQVPVDIPAPPELRMSNDPTWVYTPPGYDSSTDRYPLVVLIHGSPGHSGDWFAAGDVGRVMDVLLAHGLVQPMVVASVDVNGIGKGGLDTECLDSTTGGAQTETYLTTVVLPYLDAHYRTRADAADRAVGGFSSGGFCALDQGLRHPELFSTILALEPYSDPGSGGRAMLATTQQFAAHDVGTYAATVPVGQGTALFLGVAGSAFGSHDTSGRAVAKTLAARGMEVLVHTDHGQSHTWSMARETIPYALMFASQHAG